MDLKNALGQINAYGHGFHLVILGGRRAESAMSHTVTRRLQQFEEEECAGAPKRAPVQEKGGRCDVPDDRTGEQAATGAAFLLTDLDQGVKWVLISADI